MQLRHLVIYFDEIYSEHAIWLAARTNRDYKYVKNISTLSQISTVSVAIISSLNISAELLYYLDLCSIKQNFYPGLISASENFELFKKNIKIRNKAKNLQSINYKLIEFYGNEKIEPIVLNKRIIIGKNVNEKIFKKIISQHSDILLLNTHSDGLDIYLGNDLSICDVKNFHLHSTLNSTIPTCLQTGVCFRHNKKIQEITKSGHIISPEIISSKLLILAVCWGMHPPANVFDNSYSFIGKLTENTNIQAIIAARAIVLQNATVMQPLVLDIFAGMPIGLAVKRHNQSSYAQKDGHSISYFGDPDFFINSKTNYSSHVDNIGSEILISNLKSNILFIIDICSRISKFNSDVNYKEKIIFLQEKLFLFLKFKNESEIKLLQIDLIDIFSKIGGQIMSYWLPMAESKNFGLDEKIATTCPLCDSCFGVTKIRYFFYKSWYSPRKLISCSCCGISSDCSFTNNTTFKFIKNSIQCYDLPKRSHTALNVQVLGRGNQKKYSWNWSVENTNFIIPSIEIIGEIKIIITLLVGFEISIFTKILQSIELQTLLEV